MPAAPANHSWREHAAASNTYAAALRRVPGEMGLTHPSGNGANYGASQSYVSNNYTLEKKKVRCYNCGEYNQVQVNCRFDHKVLCGTANTWDTRVSCVITTVLRMLARKYVPQQIEKETIL